MKTKTSITVTLRPDLYDDVKHVSESQLPELASSYENLARDTVLDILTAANTALTESGAAETEAAYRIRYAIQIAEKITWPEQ